MATILAVALVVIVLAAYVMAKKGSAWGRPVLIISVLALVLVVLDIAFFRMIPGSFRRPQVGPSVEQTVGERLAKAVGGFVEPGGRVMLVAVAGPDALIIMGTTADSLSKNLGSGSEDIIRHMWMPPYTPEALSAAIRAQGAIDAVLFLGCFPAEPDRMDVSDLADPPKLLAFFWRDSGISHIRGWLEDGLLTAAIVRRQQEIEIYTPDRLP